MNELLKLQPKSRRPRARGGGLGKKGGGGEERREEEEKERGLTEQLGQPTVYIVPWIFLVQGKPFYCRARTRWGENRGGNTLETWTFPEGGFYLSVICHRTCLLFCLKTSSTKARQLSQTRAVARVAASSLGRRCGCFTHCLCFWQIHLYKQIPTRQYQ